MRMARQRERDEFRAHVAGARAGNVADMYSVAHGFASGLGTAPDVERQVTWLERAANAGEVRAPHNLGCVYDDAGDFERAHTWYRRAAALGDAASMANLGWMQEQGHAGEPDEAAAIEWYRRGADLEDPQCEYNLARLLLRRDPVGNSYRAAELMRSAAEEGLPSAQYDWAESLFHGTGTGIDPEAAEHWMQILAGEGYAEALAWLKAHGCYRIEIWEWGPGRSFGPLEFGRSIEEYVPVLCLRVDEPGSTDDSIWNTPYYPLFCQTERNRLVMASTYEGANVRIRYRDTELMGLPFESMLTLLGAGDFVVDTEYNVSDCLVSSEQLAVSFGVTKGLVSGFDAELDEADPLWR